MQDRTKAAIAVMLNSFSQQQNTDPDLLMMAYEIALEGLSDAAIQEACKRFIQGRVSEFDVRFAPSVAQFAKEAQDRQSLMDIAERAARTPKIEHKPAPVGNLISRQKMQALADWAAGRITADELEQIAKAGA